MLRKILALVQLILALFCNANAIDFDSTKESSCFNINKTVPVNLTWVTSKKLWFSPLLSRRDLYQTSVDITGKSPKNISEHEVYYKSCIRIYTTVDENMLITEGFGGQRIYLFSIPMNGLSDIQLEVSADTNGPKKKGARCYITLTNNKTFTFHACCWPDGQMTWSVASTAKELPEETKSLIHDHAESLGFKRYYFTELWYNSCKED